MVARLMAFVVWGLLACSGVYWAIQLLAKPLALPGQAVPVSESHGVQGDLARLFGAAAPMQAEPVAASEGRFQLLGVVAPRRTRMGSSVSTTEGVALIAVDGVARTVRIGAVVDGELRLLAVDARSASLGQDGVVSMSLQLAAPTAANTGALAPAAPSPVILGGNPPQGAPGQMPQPIPQPIQIIQTPEVDARGAPLR